MQSTPPEEDDAQPDLPDLPEDPPAGPSLSPADAAAAAFGLLIVAPPVPPRQPPAAPVFWLWPENIALWNAWHSLQSQWRTAGFNGQRTGLDYAACTAWLQAHGWHHRRTRSLRHALAALGAMEAAALREWAKLAQQQAAKNQRSRPPA